MLRGIDAAFRSRMSNRTDPINRGKVAVGHQRHDVTLPMTDRIAEKCRLLGDPRKLSPTDLKTYRGYADWLHKMETKYGIMSYRQDLPGFGEPMEGMWDAMLGFAVHHSGALRRFAHLAIRVFSGDI